MGKLSWYKNRLKAMSIGEVAWRIQQKWLQRQEMRTKYNPFPIYKETKGLTFRSGKLGIENHLGPYAEGACTEIHLLGGYDYKENKRAWHKDFGTGREWPRVCSYKLNYKGRDDIGDARINWELNRHYQFALLAKAYHVVGNLGGYYDELRSQIDDWITQNPFLVGISWTSVMEIAIRLIQWTIAREFLSRRQLPKGGEELLSTLDKGVLGMAGYVARHYSRYSSANNHLLVEATALAYAGYAYGYKPWQDLAVKLLDEQLERQNCSDGVNREMSLHYQAFGMEAYALSIHLMKKNRRQVPERWIEMMKKQCEFVSHSMVTNDVACEFGDNDEGKIIDLQGGEINYYRYVLQLCSCCTGTRYDEFSDTNETVLWLYDNSIDYVERKLQYNNKYSRTFSEGGYSFLRKGDIFVGIDHAPLGFGSIAAHGHADALSFQLFKNGKPIFIDPGTYIYHCDEHSRNAFRRSINHNTVTINGCEQSEMLGPFLWGKKAKTRLGISDLQGDIYSLDEGYGLYSILHECYFRIDESNGLVITDRDELRVSAETINQNGVCHRRTFLLEDLSLCGHKLTIFDHFNVECDWVATFMLPNDVRTNFEFCKKKVLKGIIENGQELEIETSDGEIHIGLDMMSPAYGQKTDATAIRIHGYGKYNKIEIYIHKEDKNFHEKLRCIERLKQKLDLEFSKEKLSPKYEEDPSDFSYMLKKDIEDYRSRDKKETEEVIEVLSDLGKILGKDDSTLEDIDIDPKEKVVGETRRKSEPKLEDIDIDPKEKKVELLSASKVKLKWADDIDPKEKMMRETLDKIQEEEMIRELLNKTKSL